MGEEKAKAADNEAILKEAKERFARCESWESHARSLAAEDDKFFNGDSDNLYQWPSEISRLRELDAKPILTINKTRQHCLQIENDAKQNTPGIVVHPTSGEASYEAAQVFEDLIRHIETQSHAKNTYDRATEHQVRRGYGAWRVVTEYRDADTFDQEIRIRSIADPNTVYFDPDAIELDKSDSRFAFVFDDMAKDKFKTDYPGREDVLIGSPSINYGGWLGDKHIRVAEYWRVRQVADKLLSWISKDTGERVTVRKSKMSPELWKQIKADDDSTFKERDAHDRIVECFKIAGDEIIEREAWAGDWIPLVPVIGEEVVIEHQMDRRGHVRHMKDAQRIYNYMTSANVETTALQTKTPFKGPAEAFEGYENEWGRANRENLAYLPYNAYNEQGQPLPPPERESPPVASEAILRGLEIAQNEMMMSSGQFQSQMGENENAKSGKAIAERQRQGDNATYHYVDHLAIALRHTGRILVDLIPKIYDTKRVLLVRGQDASEKTITIDPEQQQAVQGQISKQEAAAQLIFNPNVGKYSVEIDPGPSYSTKRQEAWNAISQILTMNQGLTSVIGDILFRNADFPGADEIAERLRRTINPSFLGEAPPPQVQAMLQQAQQELQRSQSLVGELVSKLAEEKLKTAARDAQKSVDVYDAETRRITAISNAQPELGLGAIKPVVQQTLAEMLGFNLEAVQGAMTNGMQTAAGSGQLGAQVG